MQIVRLIALVLVLFIVSGMGWRPQKPLPTPDAPEIRIIAVRCADGQTIR
jgi:hypothetical protein